MPRTRLPGPRSPFEQARRGWRMLRDPGEAMAELAAKYGPVCALGAGPFRYVYLFGADAHRELFTTDTERFSWREVTKALIVVDGDTALVVSDGDDHTRRRRVVQPAFNIRRIDGAVTIVQAEIERATRGWRPGAEFDVYEVLRACLRRIVIRTLFGELLSGQADDLGERLQPALNFVNRPLPFQIRLPLPGTGWSSVQRARAQADELIFSEIAHRRANPTSGDDVLTLLLASEALTDREVRDQVVSLIAAGYDTTSAAMGWTVFAALAHPGVWDRLREECLGALGREPITGEAVRDLGYLDGVVAESLRLWPPAIVAGRQARVPLDINGHRIDAGSIVLYSPYVTHRLPELWPDPAVFRPERWDANAAGYREPPPLAFVPFGAGPRRCIGFALATMEIKIILAHLVRTFDLEVLHAEPRHAGLASMRPRGGVHVRVRRVLEAAA